MEHTVNDHIIVRPFSLTSDLTGIVALYQACFGEAPWFEVFDPAELATEFQRLTTWPETVILIAEQSGKIVGGTVGFDLKRQTDVAELLGPQSAPHFYLSERFVDQSRRKQGIAEQLMRERFKVARFLGYSKGVVRTSVNQPIIRAIYARLEFTLAAIQHVESVKLVNGVEELRTDERVILRGKIPL